MQMMDIHGAIQWFTESSHLMVAMRKNLGSHPKDESNVLKRELIVAQRACIHAILDASSRASMAISHQMIIEQPLLMGHGEDFSALIKAQARYGAENNETWSLWKKTGLVNETAPANPQAREPSNPVDRKNRIEELMAMSSPIATNTAVPGSKADDNALDMPGEAPVAQAI